MRNVVREDTQMRKQKQPQRSIALCKQDVMAWEALGKTVKSMYRNRSDSKGSLLWKEKDTFQRGNWWPGYTMTIPV